MKTGQGDSRKGRSAGASSNARASASARCFRSFLSFGAVALIAGCSISPGDRAGLQGRMSERLGQEFADTKPAGKAAAQSAKDGDMIAAMRAAVASSEAYRAATVAVAAAEAQAKAKDSAQRLQISGGATLGTLREGDPVDATTTGAMGDLTVSQLLFDGGEATGAINQAIAAVLAAQAVQLEQGNGIALEAARAWTDGWSAQARLKELRNRTASMDALMSQIDRMAANGMVDRAAVDAAQRQMLDIQLEEASLETALEDALQRFETYFHARPSSIPKPPAIFNIAGNRPDANGWRMAPSLQRAAADLLVAQAEDEQAQAAFSPRVSMQAGLNSPMKQDDSTDLSAGFRVQYVFNDGGRREALREAARSRVESREAALSDAQRTAQAELQASLARLARIERILPMLARKIELSDAEAKTARSQIATGQSSLRQLIDAEVAGFRARDQQIRTEAEALLLQITIAANTGTLISIIGLDDG